MEEPPKPKTPAELNKQLYDAIKSKNLHAIKDAIKQGANPQQSYKKETGIETHILHAVVETNQVSIMCYFLEHLKLNFFDTVVQHCKETKTENITHDAFCVALHHCHDVAVLTYLCKYVKQQNKVNVPAASYINEKQQPLVDMTYLHYAAFQKNEEAMQVLLKFGANPYKRCKKSRFEAKSKKLSGPSAITLYPKLQQFVEQCCNFGHKLERKAFCNVIIVCIN